MEAQVNTFRQIMYLEDWKATSVDFQDKIACSLDLTITNALHLTRIVKEKIADSEKSLHELDYWVGVMYSLIHLLQVIIWDKPKNLEVVKPT